jgi:hypothetical protein
MGTVHARVRDPATLWQAGWAGAAGRLSWLCAPRAAGRVPAAVKTSPTSERDASREGSCLASRSLGASASLGGLWNFARCSAHLSHGAVGDKSAAVAVERSWLASICCLELGNNPVS